MATTDGSSAFTCHKDWPTKPAGESALEWWAKALPWYITAMTPGEYFTLAVDSEGKVTFTADDELPLG